MVLWEMGDISCILINYRLAMPYAIASSSSKGIVFSNTRENVRAMFVQSVPKLKGMRGLICIDIENVVRLYAQKH